MVISACSRVENSEEHLQPMESSSATQPAAAVRNLSFLPPKSRFILVAVLEAVFYAFLVAFFVSARNHNRAIKPANRSQARILQNAVLAFMIVTTVWNGLMMTSVVPLSFWNRLWWAYCPFLKPVVIAHMSPAVYAKFRADYADHGYAFSIVHTVLFALPSTILAFCWLAGVGYSAAALGCLVFAAALAANMGMVDLKCCIGELSNGPVAAPKETKAA
ncbi:hypothetical protein WJX72_008786 [[Myrmecia] bisecta]|uniref:Uncharacterized protein n=1 Tax=[Myrmecia] bisecta TaxID=41462 RepID=A0AAW1Q389_9CHLO